MWRVTAAACLALVLGACSGATVGSSSEIAAVVGADASLALRPQKGARFAFEWTTIRELSYEGDGKPVVTEVHSRLDVEAVDDAAAPGSAVSLRVRITRL